MKWKYKVHNGGETVPNLNYKKKALMRQLVPFFFFTKIHFILLRFKYIKSAYIY